MKKNRVPQIITGIVGVAALVGVSAGVVAINSNRETPAPTSTISAEPIADREPGDVFERQVVEPEPAPVVEAPAPEPAPIVEAPAPAPQPNPAPAPAPAPAPQPAPAPAPVFQCPPGAVDAGDGASCWWEYCFSIQPIPNPDYPECDSTFRP